MPLEVIETIEAIVAIGIGGFVFYMGYNENRHSDILGGDFCMVVWMVGVWIGGALHPMVRWMGDLGLGCRWWF